MINIALLIVVGIVVFFLILQKTSDKTYKPTRTEIIKKLRKTIDGSIDYADFDELISARIAYDNTLEEIRTKLNSIIDEKANINQPHSKTKIIYLSEVGKKRVEELINEMEKQPNNRLKSDAR